MEGRGFTAWSEGGPFRRPLLLGGVAPLVLVFLGGERPLWVDVIPVVTPALGSVAGVTLHHPGATSLGESRIEITLRGAQGRTRAFATGDVGPVVIPSWGAGSGGSASRLWRGAGGGLAFWERGVWRGEVSPLLRLSSALGSRGPVWEAGPNCAACGLGVAVLSDSPCHPLGLTSAPTRRGPLSSLEEEVSRAWGDRG